MRSYKDPLGRERPFGAAVIIGMVIGALAFVLGLAGCNGERVTAVYTGFWHSEKCHPEIYYVGNPPNASPECRWTQVAPPPPEDTTP